jgi:transposase
VVGLEACGASHHWARELQALGHQVRLVAPQHVKAYLKRGKNDARDAEAGCEAMSRPTMQFVPVKSAERQAALMLAKRREGLVRDQTRLANRIRGFAAEFGLVTPKGLGAIGPLLARIEQDPRVPELARELFADLGAELAQIQVAVAKVDEQLKAWHRQDAVSGELAQIPGVGPIGAALLVLKTPEPNLFPSARHFAAWMGLTPTDHSGRQGPPGRDHPRRRRDAAQRAGRRRHRHRRQRQARSWQGRLALADAAGGAQAAQAGRHRPGQQDRPYRLGHHGQGRALRSHSSPDRLSLSLRRRSAASRPLRAAPAVALTRQP